MSHTVDSAPAPGDVDPPAARDRAPRPRAAGPRPTRRVGFSRGALLLGLGPAVVMLVVFLGLPIVESVNLSFSRWSGVGDATWIGLDNYTEIFGADDVLSSLWLTVRYASLSALVIMVVATLLAAAAHSGLRGSKVYAFLWFLPAIAPAAAVGVFWSLAFQPRQGVVNATLALFGLGDDHAWLASAETALYPPILAGAWTAVGFAYLLVYGAMSSVPQEVYEAARLDGATGVRQFVHITLPLIRPVLITTALLQFIWAANGFTLLWAMTRGGPGDATAILPVYIYKQAFQFGDYGKATAGAVVGGLVLLAVGSLMLRLNRSHNEESS